MFKLRDIICVMHVDVIFSHRRRRAVTFIAWLKFLRRHKIKKRIASPNLIYKNLTLWQ